MPHPFLLLVLIVSSCARLCPPVKQQTVERGKKLVGHVFVTYSYLGDREVCIEACVANECCKSVNFFRKKKMCELNNRNHVSNPANIMVDVESEYIDYPMRKGCSSARSCKDVLQMGNRTSGVYEINLNNCKCLKVYCDQETDGGGWTVIQKRKDGSVDFYRGWQDYKVGFGDLTGEFWLGLDNIHQITDVTRNQLRVDLENDYAEYNYFAVDNEANKYRLSVGAFVNGTAGDSLSYHNGNFFSTKDQDNDKRNTRNCAVEYKGAWWLNACHHSSLNGLYLNGTHEDSGTGMNWLTWKGYRYSAKTTEMKIRPIIQTP